MTKTITLPVSSLEVCDRVRVRAQKPKESGDVVQDYAEAYACGLITEPLDVFRENGTERYVVADGENRLLALRRAKIKEVECRLHEGDEIAALDFAIGCNQAHGLRRTKADKYHAFEQIMNTKLRDQYSTDTDLSEKIGVSRATIQRYRAEWRNNESGSKKVKQAKAQARKRADKHSSEEKPAITSTKPRERRNATLPKKRTKAAKNKADESGWSGADEAAATAIMDALSVLSKAWTAAPRTVQIYAAETIQKTLKEMR